MLYAPHTYYVKREVEAYDEFNRLLPTSGEEWELVGSCRCDDNSVQDITDENGRVYRPKYRVVADNSDKVKAGDRVRVLRKDGKVRGEGIVTNPQRTNYYDYLTFFL